MKKPVLSLLKRPDVVFLQHLEFTFNNSFSVIEKLKRDIKLQEYITQGYQKMATVTEEPELEETEPKPLADQALLIDRTPEWFAASSHTFFFVCGLGMLYLFLGVRPLWHTDLWGHLSYGRYIVNNGHIPETEPLLPLSEGMPFVDTAWLSQVIGYKIFEKLDIPAMQFVYALSITFCIGLIYFTAYKKTRNIWICGAGSVLLLWGDWQQFLIARPQVAGLVCMITLFCLLSAYKWRNWFWFVIPGIFALWANLHGSFPVGLLILSAWTCGHAVDVFRKTRNWKSLFQNRNIRRYFLLTELSALAVLINPYGIEIYSAVISISQNANIKDLVEWEPLTLRMKQGQAAAAIVLLLIILYRYSPRRVTAKEFFLLFGFGASALWTSRMILWWVPVASYYAIIHARAILISKPSQSIPRPEKSSKWIVACIGLVWISFAYSSMGMKVIHGKQADPEKALSSQTPLGALRYLRQNPPKGLVFNTYEWGDMLLWAGPKDMKLFLASHAHLVPEDVWEHYMLISNAGPNWEALLDRYSVNTIAIDKPRRNMLINLLRKNENWKVGFENVEAAILLRKKPL